MEKAPNNKTIFIGCKNKNQSDIVIEGEGETSIIDGQGTRWWKARDNKETFDPGAMIRFEKGSRFLIRNLKVQNTPGVNITLSNSNGANNGTVHDVTIYNPSSETKTEQPSHNTDGISIWGHHMNIYNCNISTGDDNEFATMMHSTSMSGTATSVQDMVLLSVVSPRTSSMYGSTTSP